MSANHNQQYLVSPKPPIVKDELAHIGAGLRFFQSPTRFLAELREQYGDTFLVDVFGYKLFCVFSPEGLKSLYAAEEDSASFGMATFDMLGFKTPIEVFFDADIDLFYDLLKPEKVSSYITDFEDVISAVCAHLPTQGELNVFDDIRTLEQRVGFQLWIGKEASADGTWQKLKACFDVLSQESAFVNPASTLTTLTSGKAKEKQAIAQVMAIIAEIAGARDAAEHWPDDTLTFLWQRFADDDPSVTLRKVTHNAINANQGFLSNLYAALAWALIHLKSHPECQHRLEQEIAAMTEQFGADFVTNQKALDRMQFCEQLLMESIRLAQRSLTLRKVMQELSFNCGDVSYTIAPGVYIATMLSVSNVQTPELARFDPDHYKGRRIDPGLIATGKETVSTFGHGQHACPAQKFSHNMCKVLLITLLGQLDFEALEISTAPSDTQMGGVARSAEEVTLAYVKKQRPAQG